jgi:hypothetical protein
VILALGAWLLGGYGIQRSVSSYYHTNMGDVFAGILFAIGLFLFSLVCHMRSHSAHDTR